LKENKLATKASKEKKLAEVVLESNWRRFVSNIPSCKHGNLECSTKDDGNAGKLFERIHGS
jgi:hypothetical protein